MQERQHWWGILHTSINILLIYFDICLPAFFHRYDSIAPRYSLLLSLLIIFLFLYLSLHWIVYSPNFPTTLSCSLPLAFPLVLRFFLLKKKPKILHWQPTAYSLVFKRSSNGSHHHLQLLDWCQTKKTIAKRLMCPKHWKHLFLSRRRKTIIIT